MNPYNWSDHFLKIYEKALEQYENGNRHLPTYFDKAELEFLQQIGSQAAEIYDFAEDAPELSYETALLITSARRDYFLTIQQGQWSPKRITNEELPPKNETLDGIKWLPRIIIKAKARLRGELTSEIMYGCGGDRAFLNKYQIHPADFLRFIWSAKDDAQILEFVKNHSSN